MQTGMWKRVPETFYEFGIDVSRGWNSSKSKSRVADGIRVHIFVNKIRSELWKLSVYFVNETYLKNRKRYDLNDLIFQPQIRIVCSEQASLYSFAESESEDQEELYLASMYRNRRTYARGHMCSASWKDPTFSNDKSSYIFEWVDSQYLPQDVALRFMDPDVKSEYIPYYSVQQPSATKEIPAEILANSFDPFKLRKLLEPIADGYEDWIERQKQTVLQCDIAIHDTLNKNIERCGRSLNRIRSAINLLCHDEKVRLAFCFMNEAMSVQFKWESLKNKKSGQELIWYRFQLAFILQCIKGIVDPSHPDREICDLLWYPTGGGKTEAYLGLMTFTMAYRRLQHPHEHCGIMSDGGVSVISRYTLRLLTIQQFRRSVRVILACDKLRVTSWRPAGCKIDNPNLWGGSRFSIGLWVGENVTPNSLEDITGPEEIQLGALGALKGKHAYSDQHKKIKAQSEPAQILNCPCCDTILAVPSGQSNDEEGGLEGKRHTITWIFKTKSLLNDYHSMNAQGFTVNENDIVIEKLQALNHYAVTLTFSYLRPRISEQRIDQWWKYFVSRSLGAEENDLCCVRASRPGYFLKYEGTIAYDFEIYCPNTKCSLNQINWFEEIPSRSGKKSISTIPAFRKSETNHYSYGMPISAYTVDSQIYRKCPSFVIATVDKFARLPYEPQTSSIFGNVNAFDTKLGYFRKRMGPDSRFDKLGDQMEVKPFLPPSLIIQDELHLIEGPLGSITGLFELVVDILASTPDRIRPKYIASTATIRDAGNQVRSLFDRDFAIFPSPGLTIEDSYFSSSIEADAFDADRPGRLYVGICTPGKALIPIVRMWSVLLREVQLIRTKKEFTEEEVDYFWTLVGYFNSLKELAIARGIYSGNRNPWKDR